MRSFSISLALSTQLPRQRAASLHGSALNFKAETTKLNYETILYR